MGLEKSQYKDKKDKSLSICFFSHSSLLAGAERSLLELVTELIRDYGVICTVFLPNDGPLTKKLEEAGASTFTFKYDWWCGLNSSATAQRIPRFICNFKTTLENIKEEVENIDPDIVFTNTMVIPWGAMVASRLNKPHVWFVREFGVLDYGLKFYLPFPKVLNIIRESSNIVLTNSTAVRKTLFGDTPGSNILTISPHIDIPPNTLLEDKDVYYRKKEATKLIIVGTILKAKGQGDAIRAVRELMGSWNIELIVIGNFEPTYLSELRGLVQDANLEGYVRFVDFKENIYPIINQADIVLVCSKNEAFGRIIIEAMLLKKAVIGTKAGGISELVEEGFNGLLYEPGDYKQLAMKIEYLLKQREKIKEVGENGYKFAKENFSKEKSVGKIYELLQDIKNMPNPSSPSYFALIDMHHSPGWKLLLCYYRIRDKILPINSHRRNAVKRVFRGGVSLRNKLKKKPVKSADGTSFYQVVKPTSVRIEASTICQLSCPSCPNATGQTHKKIGAGFLKYENFKKIIDNNVWIRDVELSNWGEIFLNPDLLKIIKYAYEKNVVLRADNGVNLNTVSDEVLEALVRYQFHSMTCSIDGASQKTYSTYRRKGNFEKVIEHIERINYYKSKYKSEYPILTWQFIAFGHNTHEIGIARKMAADLKMNFFLKLSWDDLYTRTFSPVTDKNLVRRETGLGVSSRKEYLAKTGEEYIGESCLHLWKQPQINFDGRVLGCSCNYRGDFGNVFKDGLVECLNNEKINYARDMLFGIRESRDDIPCAGCKLYESRRKRSAWVKDMHSKKQVENKKLVYNLTKLLRKLLAAVKRRMRRGYLWEGLRADFNRFFWNRLATGLRSRSSLVSRVYPLRIPLPAAEEDGWKPYPLFNMTTSSMQNLSCHASVLNTNHSPHLPHTHDEEEILMLLWGEVDLILPDRQGPAVNQRIHLKQGEFVYYPACFAHTLQTTSETPANYLMFRWQGGRTKNKSPLSFRHFSLFESNNGSKIRDGFFSRRVFEEPTAYLRKLHCHTSTLTPGAGYEAHRDDYDVAIIVLEGTVKTLGKQVRPYSVIFYRAGEPHGMRNTGASIANYVVFEFHQ
jgi:glycosyltransferase involved in cell wall biosynthesis/MoaA/NifB/PqqE/SkfB family radical SAM enzyme/mannose-6-phosphate isomerase-like protein (cupin superfamily)